MDAEPIKDSTLKPGPLRAGVGTAEIAEVAASRDRNPEAGNLPKNDPLLNGAK